MEEHEEGEGTVEEQSGKQYNVEVEVLDDASE